MRTTICVPVFNGAATLAETLSSAFSQVPSADEVLLVDNASTDDTLAVARGFDSHGLRVHVNPTNVGFNQNFNRCLELAQGDRVLILSADDILYPQALERLRATLEQYPDAGFAFSGVDLINAEGEEVGSQQSDLPAGLIPGRRFLEQILLHAYPTVLNTTLFDRQRLLAVGGFDRRYVNSDFVVAALLSSRWDVAHVPEALGAYRVVSDSTGERLLYGRSDLLTKKLAMCEGLFASLDDEFAGLRGGCEQRWVRFAEGMLVPARVRYGWMRAAALAIDIARNRPFRPLHPRFAAAAAAALLLPAGAARLAFRLAAAVLGKGGAAVQRSYTDPRRSS